MSDEVKATPEAPKVDPGGLIPIARLNEVLAERDTLRSRVAELEPIQASYASLQAKYDTDRNALAEERDLARRGLVDPEAVEVARFAYSRVPEAGRPKSLVDYVAASMADPESAHLALRAFFPTAPVTASSVGVATVAAPAVAPVAPTSVASPAPSATGVVAGSTERATAPAVTADSLRAARERAMRTGDWADFDALTSAHMASRTAR